MDFKKLQLNLILEEMSYFVTERQLQIIAERVTKYGGIETSVDDVIRILADFRKKINAF